MKPTITVITPTYNRANFIKETIDSVLAQSYKDFEYIIIDDGSTDNTKEVVKPYLKDKRVRYISHSNRGEPESVNVGWRLAKGKYFTQVNSDDPILPELFSEMVNVFEKNPKVIVAYPNFYFINKSGKIILHNKNPEWNFIDALSSFSCYAASPGTFIRKSVITWESIRDSRFKYINDIYMYWNMALIGDFFHVDKFLATWRQHQGGISSDRYKSIPEDNIWFNEYFQQKLPQAVKKCKEKTRKAMYQYFIALLEQSNYVSKQKEINFYKKKLGMQVYKYRNLQISDNDTIGNKFNGHNLHFYLRERNIDSRQLVWNKKSKDEYTYIIGRNNKIRETISKMVGVIQYSYSLNNVLNPLFYDVLYDPQFLESDIVHLHLLHNNLFDIQLLPLMSKIKPIIWTLHDPWAIGGHCVHHFDCNRWQNFCHDCPYLNAHIPLQKDNSSLNYEIKQTAIVNSNIECIVASKWMYSKIKKSPAFKNKKIHLVPFGIDFRIFKKMDKVQLKKKYKIPQDSVVLMFRCDYSQYKGIDYIRYVLNNLEVKEKIYIITVDKKPSFKIKFPHVNKNWVYNDTELAELYNVSDMLLMPSKVESFGMMAIEAMSCGCVPIVLNNTSLPQIINSPSCGISVSENKDTYLKTISYFITHKEELQIRSKKCIDFSLKNYDHKKYINRIEHIYDQAISKFKITPSMTNLINQLYKYNPGDIEENNFINRSLSDLERIIILLFYKFDKVVPSTFRKKVKNFIQNLINFNT